MTELFGQVSTVPQRFRAAYRWYVPFTTIGDPPHVVKFRGEKAAVDSPSAKALQSGPMKPLKHEHSPDDAHVPAREQCAAVSQAAA